MEPSQRSGIPPFYVMEVMRAAADRERSGQAVLHLEVGQPSTPAPKGALAAAEQALVTDRIGYTHALGMDSLREAISGHYASTWGTDIDPQRIVVTTGASAGFTLALLAAFDTGDRIGITEPGYAAYRNIITALGLELVGIPVDETTRFVPTPEAIERHLPLAGLVTASPSNPTGTALTAAEQRAIVDRCRAAGVTVLADEIYHGIVYGDPTPSVVAGADDAIVIQSFSKYFSMTGWRIGWNVMPEPLIRPFERLAQNLYISPPTLSQIAAAAAFDCREELDANVARYAANRETLIAGLQAAGIQEIAPADGAFYLWANVEPIAPDSATLSRRWLEEIGVAVTPGIDFDPERGSHQVRLSYSESHDDISAAAERIATWTP